MVATGGVVLLTAPFQYQVHTSPSENIGDYFRYTHEGLAVVGKSAGFVVVKQFGIGNRRELEAQNAGFWVSSVPEHVFAAPADDYYHSAVVVLQKKL